MKTLNKLTYLIIPLAIILSCSHPVKNQKVDEQKVINEYSIVHSKFSNLFDREQQYDYLRPKTLIPDHKLTDIESKALKDSTTVWLEKTKTIRDSIDILSTVLDSLLFTIQDFPSCVHRWTNKPYSTVLDSINTHYRLTESSESQYTLNVRDGYRRKEIKWNMEDITALNNLISSVLKFKPELDKYNNMLWTARAYDIEVTREFKIITIGIREKQ